MTGKEPAVRPARPFFSSGPCAKRPGWTPDALSAALLGRSHRSKPGKAKLKDAIDRTKKLLGIPDDYRGEAAKAFIKLRAGSAAFSLDDLKAFLAGKLGRHEIPSALEFVDELPRTPVGKLSRHELRGQQAKSQPARVKQPQLATGGRP